MIHQSILQILAPRYCLICEAQLMRDVDNAPAGVCDDCRTQLPTSPDTLPESYIQPGPARVPAPPHKPTFINTVSAFFYEQPVQNLIKDYKFRGRLDIGAGLADELARRTSSHPIPDALVPVPLHPRRLRQRGFNQATEIARRLSLQHKIPILINNINRIHWSMSQTGLSAGDRQLNLARAFAVNRSIPAHIAIVDDVVTSGATGTALMQALHRSGGTRFQLWVLARAVIPGEDAR